MKYIVALFLVVASFGSAFADSQDTTTFTVPFAFFVGDISFSPGTYSISRISQDAGTGLRIQSKDGKTTAFFHPLTSAPSDDSGQVKIEFRHEGDEYFLTGIFGEFNAYKVALGHHQGMGKSDGTAVTVGLP